jgi:hypothetical protein
MIQEGFNANAIPAFREVQENEAAHFLDGMSTTPDVFPQHVRRSVYIPSHTSNSIETTLHRFAAGSIVKLAYGHTVESIDDEFVVTADRAASRSVEAGSPGSMIVDLFPACKFIIHHTYHHQITLTPPSFHLSKIYPHVVAGCRLQAKCLQYS